MSDLAIGGLGFAVLFLLIALRVPIGVAMISVGMVGYTAIAGLTPLLSFLKTEFVLANSARSTSRSFRCS